VGNLTTRLALAAAAFAAALLVAIIALWFLGQALFLELETTPLSPAGAAAIVGVVGLVLVALIALAGRSLLHPRRVAPAAVPPPAVTQSSGSAVNDLALQVGTILAQKAAATSRTHPYGTVGSALVAGLAVGAIPELRRMLLSLFER